MERTLFPIIFTGMSEDVITNMRDRAARCRRLARTVLDKSASDALTQLAEEIEADMRRLKKSQSAQA
jgi:hypothetical protein